MPDIENLKSRFLRTKELAAMRGDVSALRSGLTSLTNSMFSLKQQQQQDKDKIQQQGLDGAAAKELRDKVDRVAGDVTAVGREVSRLRRDYSTAGAEVKALSGDVSSFKSRFTSVTKQVRKDKCLSIWYLRQKKTSCLPNSSPPCLTPLASLAP